MNKSVDVVQYASAEVLPGGIEATFIPMRNLLFLTLAANRAYHHGARILVVGVSQEDFGGYPDCREQFLISANKTIHHAAGESELAIWAPVLFLSKKLRCRSAWKLWPIAIPAITASSRPAVIVMPVCCGPRDLPRPVLSIRWWRGPRVCRILCLRRDDLCWFCRVIGVRRS